MHSFGVWLRQERERRSITLEELSMLTKIRIYFLRAIEEERANVLPPGAIGRGFVRSYARGIGVDEAQAIEEYSRLCMERKVVDAPQSILDRYRGDIMRLPMWPLAAIFLAIGLGLVSSGQQLRRLYYFMQESPAEQTYSATPNLPQLATAAVIREETRKYRAPSTYSAKRSSASLPAKKVASASQEPSLTPAVVPVRVEAVGFTLKIKVRRDAWMTVISDGHRVLSETLVAPAETLVKAQTHITVRAGNIGAVEFSFNGVSLPPQGAYDEARTLSFNVHGLETPASDATLPGIHAFPTSVPQGAR